MIISQPGLNFGVVDAVEFDALLFKSLYPFLCNLQLCFRNGLGKFAAF